MKIKSLYLKNFKRFTDLTLKDIPENAKLVLLIGNNGSGKSSVFDAFEYFSVQNGKQDINAQLDFRKEKTGRSEIAIESVEFGIDGVINGSLQKTNKINKDSFYGRTSFRQVPRLTRTSLGNGFNIQADNDRAASFIDRDLRFENDLEHLFGKLLKEFFRTTEDKSEIKENVINPVNAALQRIFNKENGTKLQLIEIIPPLEGKLAEINFKKGESIFNYNYLSAGEKEVFNILINLVARKEYYTDTIFFFDEIDLHLNTKLQYNFLKEIVENWIPDNCQFWKASHSLGFIDYANDSNEACIIDLGDLDFDKLQVLTPKSKNNIEIFEIAVSKAFINKVVQGRKIIFPEKTNTPFYNDLNIDNTFFFFANDKNDVFLKAKNHKQFGLIDRDYLSDEDVTEIKKTYPFLYTLPYYSFENLIYHPHNLSEYYKNKDMAFNAEKYIDQIAQIKNQERDYLAAGIIQARSGYPSLKKTKMPDY